MKVATYRRISTDEERQPFSLEAQRDRLSAYIASQDGWHLVRSFTDQQSGKTLDRPDLQRALAEARLGSYELLLVHKVDRLARSVRGLAQILEDLDAVSVAFRSATEPFDTSTAAGRMMVQMLGVFAEFERATIVERTVMGLSKKAAKGSGREGRLRSVIATTAIRVCWFRFPMRLSLSKTSSSVTRLGVTDRPRSPAG